MKTLALFLSLIFIFSESSLAAPSGLTLQGRLVKDGSPVSGSVGVTVSITSPNSDLCLLFEETHSITLGASDDGVFSVFIGSGTRTGNDKGFTLTNVFSNTGNAINSLSCSGSVATSYTPLATHSRYVYLSFTTPVGNVSFNDPYVVQSVPYALEAEKLAGKTSSEYLQTTANTTQTKLNDLMVPATYTELSALLNGSSAQYMTTSNSSPTKLPVLSSTPSSPSTGQIWYESGALKYYDGSASQIKTLGTAGTTLSSYGITDAVVKGGQTGALALGTTDANNLTLTTNNTAKMTVLSDGKVGIGIASPVGILHVYGTDPGTSSTGLLKVEGTAQANIVLTPASSFAQVSSNPIVANTPFYITNNSGDLILRAGSAAEVMRLKNGSVGIGTASPSAATHIVSTSETLRLGYDASNYVSFTTSSGGALTVTPSGGIVNIAGTGSTAPLAISNNSAGIPQTLKLINTAAAATNGGSSFGFYGTSSQSTMGLVSAAWSAAATTDSYMSFTVRSSNTLSEKMRITAGGNIGIGVTGANYKLDVDGDINTSTCFRIGATTVSGTCTSDERLKEDIQDYTAGLDDLLNIKLHTYKFNGLGEMPKTGEVAVGVIAQEVEKTNPELVKTRSVKMRPDDKEKTEIKVVDYSKFLYMLINAVKELHENWFSDHQEIQNLKRENASLKAYLCSKDPQAPICQKQ